MTRWRGSQGLFELVDSKGPHEGDRKSRTRLFASLQQRTPVAATIAQTCAHAESLDTYEYI